jgi:ligand-binding sensor domain-containing protein/signal transduction histidine kinase
MYIVHRYLLLFILSGLSLAGFAQRYHFSNITVEDGLIQSQVSTLCQDLQGHLWMGTIGGMSRYDGKRFTHYNTKNGLLSNGVNDIIADSKGNIWCATQRGLSRFNGRSFFHFIFSPQPPDSRVARVLEDAQGNIWCTNDGKLMRIKGDSYEKINLPGGDSLRAYALACDANGTLWVGGMRLWYFKNGVWETVPYPAFVPKFYWVNNLFADKQQNIWLVSPGGLYLYKNGSIQIPAFFKQLPDGGFMDMTQDQAGNYWIGTSSGAYQVTPDNRVTHFSKENGLTENSISAVMTDREHNIYRYSGDLFTSFNENNGLHNPVAMSLAMDSRGQVWAGTYGGGLHRFNGKTMDHFSIPSPYPSAQIINCMVADANDAIWLGSSRQGLWRYDGKKFTSFITTGQFRMSSIFDLHRDSRQRIWIGTSTGIGLYENNRFSMIPGDSSFVTSFTEIGNDSILAGTSRGLRLIHQLKKTAFTGDPLLQSIGVQCLKRFGDNVWIGTGERGIIRWNLRDQSVENITTDQGLSSDFIYNLQCTPDGFVWAGTGYGINRLFFDPATKKTSIKLYGRAEGVLGMESNQNASLRDTAGRLWFGTTRGIFIYTAQKESGNDFNPDVILQSVKLFSKPIEKGAYTDSLSSWYNIPLHLTLPHGQNNLSFEFTAIHLTNPEEVSYQYMLEGLNNEWSLPANISTLSFPALQPGKYVLKVRALSNGQISTGKMMEYPFEITAPFYQATWFRLMAIIALVLTGVIIQALRTLRKQKRARLLNSIRKEEQDKVRQRTAEDFHDEMGNKLTRINILTDILKSKMGGNHTELSHLADQIKENSIQLYSGTRDIIWSLNPASDNLYEILQRIRDFGSELFDETEVSFAFQGLEESYRDIKLPIDYSRNLIMIFKEALTNALRHAACTQVTLEVKRVPDEQLSIRLSDDGSGFKEQLMQKGHGIANMNIRATRIGASLKVDTFEQQGTIIELRFKIPPNEG